MNNKYDNLRKYNQLLLAIGGTLALIFFLGLGIIFIIDQINFSNNYEYPQEGVIAIEETEKLLEDSLRKQIISSNNIHLIDSTNKIYLLPIRQANIKEGESTDDLMGLTNSMVSTGKYMKRYRPDPTFNNIVVYNSKLNKSKTIFDTRICISSYSVLELNNNIDILIIGTNIDSNKDQFLNKNDLQELFIYNVRTNSLSKLTMNSNNTTLNIIEPEKSDDIFGKFGVDRNKDGEYTLGVEPMIIRKIDLKSKSIINVIDEQQIEKLQELLEGR